MNKLFEIKPIFCKYIPNEPKHGFVYISEEYQVAVHLCACGCGEKAPMPFCLGEWKLIKHSPEVVSFEPSVGNWAGEKPDYHAHYFIRENKIVWC